MKVNKHTRAPYYGKYIVCPLCDGLGKVYHFSWCGITCGKCKSMVDKYDWLLQDETKVILIEKIDYHDVYYRISRYCVETNDWIRIKI